jgi:DNA-binding MarR family transcriptional regulator
MVVGSGNGGGWKVATRKAGRTDQPPSFRNLMTFRLHRVARISERISEQHYRKHLGLTLPECRVIGITASYGSVSFKRVAAAAYLEKSYASRVVSALVERDLLEKQANPSDSRSVLLQLTAKGRAVHEQTYALALRLNELLQQPFRRAQVDNFVAFLDALEQRLDQTSGLIEGSEDFSEAPALIARISESFGADLAHPPMPDREFARQLHALLGKYLATEE